MSGFRRRCQGGLGVLVALAVTAVGCASSSARPPRSSVRSPRAASFDEVLAAYDGYCRSVNSLSASGDLDVHDLRTGKTHRLGFRLVATRSGRLYLKGSVAVVTALEVVSDGARFWFVLPSRKTVWTGASAARHLAVAGDEAPYQVLRPGDIVEALMPSPLELGPDEVLVLEADASAYSVSVVQVEGTRGRLRRRIWLVRDTLVPSRTRTYDGVGETLAEVDLGQWQDGLPRFITVSRPQEGYQAGFSLSKVDRNGKLPEKAFQPRLPEGYTVVEVQ